MSCIYMKKMRKILLCMLHKEAGNAHFYKALKEKEKHKNNKKRRGYLICIYTERSVKNIALPIILKKLETPIL